MTERCFLFKKRGKMWTNVFRKFSYHFSKFGTLITVHTVYVTRLQRSNLDETHKSRAELVRGGVSPVKKFVILFKNFRFLYNIKHVFRITFKAFVFKLPNLH